MGATTRKWKCVKLKIIFHSGFFFFAPENDLHLDRIRKAVNGESKMSKATPDHHKIR